MTKKSPKKLTPNQAEFRRLLKNARQRYNRYLKMGYKSQYTSKDLFSAFERPDRITKKMLKMLKQELKEVTNSVLYAETPQGEAISFADIPKDARAQYNKLGYTEFKYTSPEGVESNITLSYGNAPLPQLNEASLAFSNFIKANARWATDEKKHAGMEYIIEKLREERKNLQNLYGNNEGDAVFAYMLNEIGVASGTLTSQEANDTTAAGRWLSDFYKHREAGVEEMMKLNEAFGEVEV